MKLRVVVSWFGGSQADLKLYLFPIKALNSSSDPKNQQHVTYSSFILLRGSKASLILIACRAGSGRASNLRFAFKQGAASIISNQDSKRIYWKILVPDVEQGKNLLYSH